MPRSLTPAALVVLAVAGGLAWPGASSQPDARAANAPVMPSGTVCVEWRTRLGDPSEPAGPWEPIGVIPRSQESRGTTRTGGPTITPITVSMGWLTSLESHAVLYRACSRYGPVQEAVDAVAAYAAEADAKQRRRMSEDEQVLDALFRKWVGRRVVLKLADGTRRSGTLRSVDAEHLVLVVGDGGGTEEILKTDVVSGEAL